MQDYSVLNDWLITVINNFEARVNFESIITILNSNFFTALLGSLAGAYAGAYAAQKIAQRNKTREQLSQEIRNINAAITLTYSVFNIALQLKNQYIGNLSTKYHEDFHNFKEFQKLSNEAQNLIVTPFHLQIDGYTLAPLNMNGINKIQDLIFSQMSSPPRVICLVATLSQTLDTLNEAIKKRNELVYDFRTSNYSQDDLVNLYFGLSNTEGHLNQMYPDTLEVISNFTDDFIFFSYLLCCDLQEYGHKVGKKFNYKTKSTVGLINEIKFDLESGLIPNKENYPSWFSSFKSKDPF